MAKGSGSGDFVAGFLFGAFVGAILALLFAPAPGEEVRERVREKGIELKERAEDASTEARKRVQELSAQGKTLFDEQKVRFQEAVEEGKKAAARKKEELLGELEEVGSQDSVELTEQEADA